MKWRGYYLVVIIMFLFYGEGLVKGFTRAGTSGAQFLKIEVGGRATALGGSVVADPEVMEALYWNPAALLKNQRINLGFYYNQWFLDIRHSFAGFSLRVNQNLVVGLYLNGLYMDDQEVTTITAEEGTGLYYSVSEVSTGLALARRITDHLNTGIIFKFIQENYYNESASSYALDFGSIFKTDFHDIRIGMSLSNFGGDLRFEGRDLISKSDVEPNIGGNYLSDSRLKTESWPLPLLFRVGLAIPVMGQGRAFINNQFNQLNLYLSGEHPNDNRERVSLGLEYKNGRFFSIQLGYKKYHDLQRFSYGFGLQIPIQNQMEISLYFATMSFGDLGRVLRYSIQLQL